MIVLVLKNCRAVSSSFDSIVISALFCNLALLFYLLLLCTYYSLESFKMSSARDRVIRRLNQEVGDGTDRFGQAKVLIQYYNSVFIEMKGKVKPPPNISDKHN